MKASFYDSLLKYNLIALILLSVAGCVSGYKEFYKPTEGLTPERLNAIRASVPPLEPIVERAKPGNSDLILDSYAKRGYEMIGNSFFNSGHDESESSAIMQAKVVGADLVLILNPSYTGTVTSSMPITKPTTTTSYTTSRATAYGSGGTATAYGSGTTTTYGTTTDYIPIVVHRSDYGAVYFIKRKFIFGASLRDLNDIERQKLESNKGTVIRLITDDTPAYSSDFLAGDIIKSIDKITIKNSENFTQLLNQKRGSKVVLEIIRNEKIIEKEIQLNN